VGGEVRTGIIYHAFDTTNGKCYVGQTWEGQVRASNTSIEGVKLVEFDQHSDSRGTFENIYDAEFLLKHTSLGSVRPWKVARARNGTEHTLRGLHYQLPPFDENKFVHCSRGAICDVVVDLRRESPTFGKYLMKSLREVDPWGLWIPSGCAHGYMTLQRDTVVEYVLNNAYSEEHSRGIVWNDPLLAIPWPAVPMIVSQRDMKFPGLGKAELP
jgi:dTDP-4-dehydrorhamnose 3,5-epimerase